MIELIDWISLHQVIVAAIIGAAASLYVYKTQYKKSTYLEMYKRCYSPIYYLLREDIEVFSKEFTIPYMLRRTLRKMLRKPLQERGISNNKAEAQKEIIMRILDYERPYCPKELYAMSLSLSPDSYREYCLFIWDNYIICQSRLGMIALKSKIPIRLRQIKVLFSFFMALFYVSVIIFSAILYLSGEKEAAFIVAVLALFPVALWIIIDLF